MTSSRQPPLSGSALAQRAERIDADSWFELGFEAVYRRSLFIKSAATSALPAHGAHI
jgi:hypothetical protein